MADSTSINIGASAWESLKYGSSAMITISSECSTEWFMPFFMFELF